MSINQLRRRIESLRTESDLIEEIASITLGRLEAGQTTNTEEENTLAAA